MADHAAFISRVRAALGRTEASGAPTLEIARENETVVHTERTVARFAERASIAGMVVHRSSRDTLDECLIPLLADRRVAVSIEDPSLQRSTGAPAVHWRTRAGLDALYDADIGVTDVLAAIAETGTLVIRSSSSTTRGGFLVPPVHVALVRNSQVIPDMVDLWPLLRPMPTSVVLITGPSKTADIEGILITGVHGPREVHIILIEDV